MTDCCESKACEIAVLRERQRHVLVIVLWINLVMFGVEFAAGWIANSSALLADSLDMLGDALVYGFSLYVLARSAAWRAGAALLKGLIQAAFGSRDCSQHTWFVSRFHGAMVWPQVGAYWECYDEHAVEMVRRYI